MTKHKLLYNVALIIGILLSIFVFAVYSKYFLGISSIYDVIRDFYPIFIAVSAAYLAYCFQRRQTFLISLRELWKDMIDAKHELVAYTSMPNPNRESFDRAHSALSKVIDAVRGVYENADETEASIGFYPFEPLHDMRRSLERLGYERVTSEQQQIERKRVLQAWNALRWAFLREFSRPAATQPILARDAHDPRRPKDIEGVE